MGRQICLHPLTQDLDDCALTGDRALCRLEAMVAVGDLDLTGAQVGLQTSDARLQGSHLADQLEHDPRKIERRVPLMDALDDFVKRDHASAE